MTLHQAARSGDEAEVRRLVANGVNVDELDENGWTPLLVAGIKLLVQLGANKEAKNANVYGETPLHCAAGNGHVEAIKLLVQLGANKEARHGRAKSYGGTALHCAAGTGTWRRSTCWCSSAWTRTRRQGGESCEWIDGATRGGNARAREGDQDARAARRGQGGEV